MKTSYAEQDNVNKCFFAATKGKYMRRKPLHKRIANFFVKTWHLITDYFYYRKRGYSRAHAFHLATRTI